jgi:hypothetical protein
VTVLAPIKHARRWVIAAALLVALVVAALAVALSGSGTSAPPSIVATASIIPGDALVYVSMSLDRNEPAVKQALAVGRRFPDFTVGGTVELGRLDQAVAGGRAVDFSSHVAPWAGSEAALVLLNTATSTAGSLIVVDVADRSRAQSFVRGQGAVADGSYRGTALLRYPNGSQVAFVGPHLVVGQDASVREAIDVAAGSRGSLVANPTYERAASTMPAGTVLAAYASTAGVRRVLAAQGGVLGALGSLLYQPALQGVSLALTPTAQGARIQIHSALDPSLVGLSGARATAFSPSLQDVMPAGATLMLDVTGLDRAAPQVLNAGSAAGIAGGIGALLSRLGSALSSEGVNVKDLVSIFHGESAVAIVPGGKSPALLVVARTSDQKRTQDELAQLEAPLAQLFASPSKSSSSEPVFSDRQVSGVTVHQLALTTGFQLDYAVFRGLVVISTSLQGIADVAGQTHPLSRDPGFVTALGSRPRLVTSMVFADLGQLLGVGKVTGLSGSPTYTRLQPDLQKIGAVGLTSTRTADDSTTDLTIQVK